MKLDNLKVEDPLNSGHWALKFFLSLFHIIEYKILNNWMILAKITFLVVLVVAVVAVVLVITCFACYSLGSANSNIKCVYCTGRFKN